MSDLQDSLLQIAMSMALKVGINNARRHLLYFLDSKLE